MKEKTKNDVYIGQLGYAADFLNENPEALDIVIQQSKLLRIRRAADRFRWFMLGIAVACIAMGYCVL